MILKSKTALSIFLIWLFNISGILGILFSNPSWFLKFTPVNLLLYVVLILWNSDEKLNRFFTAFAFPFFIGFTTEYLGVNYGWIFGTYSYGDNLGLKIGGVPITICINWAILTIVTSDLSRYISGNLYARALIGGILMTLLDVIIEVSAPRFDFWLFESDTIPLKNYIAWLVIGSLAHYFYQRISIKTHQSISIHIFVAIGIFFCTFLFF